MDSLTLLCIDDPPQLLNLRKTTLESQGYCVQVASSGHSAMKILEETLVAAWSIQLRSIPVALLCGIAHSLTKRVVPGGQSDLFSRSCQLFARRLILISNAVNSDQFS